MKKILLACVAVSLFIACSKKDIQKWLNKPGNPKPPVPCKIDSIYPVGSGDPAAVAWTAVGIQYNDKGNPVKLNYTLFGIYPYNLPEKFSVDYRYDSKNRLIEIDPPYVDPIGLTGEITRHKFVYEGNAQLPVRDTILSDTFFGIKDGAPWQVYSVSVEHLYYDQHGRINRTVTKSWQVNTPETTVFPDREAKFSYDAKGNRQVITDGYGNTPPAVIYTNKPSLYSLHPVWQLINKNWSKNAAQMDVQTYNSNGLPTKVDLSKAGFLNTRVSESLGNPYFNIKYTCY